MKTSIAGGVLEELETTAGSLVKQSGQAVKGIGSDAVGQITGQSKTDHTGTSQWEQIVGKPMDPKQYQKMEQSDEAKKQKNLAAIRRNLQQALESPTSSKQDPEPPKYIKAKIEKQQKMQKEFEEQKKKPPPLNVRSAQGMASAETRGGWGVGG